MHLLVSYAIEEKPEDANLTLPIFMNTLYRVVPVLSVLLSSVALVFFSAGPGFAAASEGTVMEKTIAVSLEPVLKLFAGNGWLQGGVVILITFGVASVLTWILYKIIRKVTTRTSIEVDDQIAKLLRPPLYYSFLVSGISYGISLMPLAAGVELLTGRCVKTVGLLVWLIFFIRLASLLLNRLALYSHKFSFIQRRTLTLFDNGAKVLIFGIGIYVFFVIWNINMTAWLASAGIVGIAVGFAAKDTLSNLFSGVFILADAPYKVGDYVVMDRGDRGQVRHIGLRSTRILTRDDVEVTIPNSIIGNSTIINQSGGPTEKLRIRVKVGVAYGSDIDQVKEILLAVAKEEPLACTWPEPRVRFRLFGASSLDFELLCWVDRPELRGRAIDGLNSEIYRRFTSENIEIPYAKQDLYIKDIPDSLVKKLVREDSSLKETS